ncbi:MAG: sigma-70 family RNA polymerase sigma factor [Myxococcaceae bacterium]|nr:MAG: sigma-70 family RNA polymerase sigma factor [Myxococcaceae bacterium]
MTRPAEDRTVLDAVRRGDQRSLEELYRRHSPRLYALLLRMLRETADAEEVLQETFIDAWRRAGEYSASRGSVEAWLITIARSRAIDRIRNRGARLRLVKQSEQLATADAPQPEPPDVHAQTRLRKALGTLPPEQRRALELAYWDGLSQSEISRETGDPLGTVKTRVRLGLQRLAELLAG